MIKTIEQKKKEAKIARGQRIRKELNDTLNEINELLKKKDSKLNLKKFLRLLGTKTGQNKFTLLKENEKYRKKLKNQRTILNRKINNKVRRHVLYELRRNNFLFKVNPDIAAKFKIICYSEFVSSRRLVESFMLAFIEGDPVILEFLKKTNNYHEKSIFLKPNIASVKKRFKRCKMIQEYYSIPDEWFEKYADIRPNEIEF